MYHPLLFYFHTALVISYATTIPPLSILSSLPLIYLRGEEILFLWGSIAGAATGHILNRKRPTNDYVALVAQFLVAFFVFDGSLLVFNVASHWSLPLIMCVDYFTLTWRRFKLKSFLVTPVTLALLISEDLSIQLIFLPIHTILVLLIFRNDLKKKKN